MAAAVTLRSIQTSAAPCCIHSAHAANGSGARLSRNSRERDSRNMARGLRAPKLLRALTPAG